MRVGINLQLNYEKERMRERAKRTTQMGLEPTTSRSEVGRAIHCATRPWWLPVHLSFLIGEDCCGTIFVSIFFKELRKRQKCTDNISKKTKTINHNQLLNFKGLKLKRKYFDWKRLCEKFRCLVLISANLFSRSCRVYKYSLSDNLCCHSSRVLWAKLRCCK